MCQNGVSPAGGTGEAGEAGVASSVALPAVPLPESVARSLNSGGGPVPYGASTSSTSASGSATTTTAPTASPSSAPKPLYRPFALSPPPSSSTGAASKPSASTAGAAEAANHPTYRSPSVHPQLFGSHSAAASPYDPFGLRPPIRPPGLGAAGGLVNSIYSPHFPLPSPAAAASAATAAANRLVGIPPFASPAAAPFNGLFPPRTTVPPSSSLTGTVTVSSSHQDLTCKNHSPKLAHALTATSTASPGVRPSVPSSPYVR